MNFKILVKFFPRFLEISILAIFCNFSKIMICFFFVKIKKNYCFLTPNFFNNLGQLIHQETISANKKTINVSKFDKGLYFIEINKGTRKILRKLLIN